MGGILPICGGNAACVRCAVEKNGLQLVRQCACAGMRREADLHAHAERVERVEERHEEEPPYDARQHAGGKTMRQHRAGTSSD